MKLYIVPLRWGKQIEVVEAVKTSDKCYWTERGSSNTLRKQHRETAYDMAFENLDEAADKFISIKRNNHEAAKRELNTTRNELNEAEKYVAEIKRRLEVK